MGAVTLGLAAAFIAFGIFAPFKPWSYVISLWGLLVAFLGATLALDVFTPNPILRIDSEGIYFLPFSPITVPWRDVTSVSQSQGYYSNGGGVTGGDGKLSFRYSVRDPSAYPKRGGISGFARATMSGNTVTLNTLTLIDAKGSDLLAAFREHYPGAIREIPVPGAPPANP